MKNLHLRQSNRSPKDQSAMNKCYNPKIVDKNKIAKKSKTVNVKITTFY